jgi:hypothetical protein
LSDKIDGHSIEAEYREWQGRWVKYREQVQRVALSKGMSWGAVYGRSVLGLRRNNMGFLMKCLQT